MNGKGGEVWLTQLVPCGVGGVDGSFFNVFSSMEQDYNIKEVIHDDTLSRIRKQG